MSDKWIFLVYGSVKCVFLYFMWTGISLKEPSKDVSKRNQKSVHTYTMQKMMQKMMDSLPARVNVLVRRYGCF
jgi:hypothetical protein